MATVETEFIAGKGFVARHIGAAVRFAVSLITGGVVAYGAAQYQQATRDARIERNAERIEAVESEIVPRREHEAHWKAIEDAQRATEQRVEKIDDKTTQILLRLTK